MDNTENQTIVYIASDTRSGSTLLDMILNSDPAVVSIGESKMLYEYYNGICNARRRGSLCSCGELVSECSFWNEVNEQIRKIHKTDLAELITRVDIDEIFLDKSELSKVDKENLVIRNMKIIYEAIFKVKDCKVIVDSSKKHDHLKFCQKAHDNVKVIKLLRDGRGVVNSKKKRNQIDVIRASYFWVRNNIKIDKEISKIPSENILFIKYEDICNNTDEILKKISEFTGIRSLNLNRISKLEMHNIAGSPHKFSRKKFIIKEDKKWRHNLNVFEKFLFAIIGGYYQIKNGYDIL